jgi:hypothetical protein
MNAYWCHLEGRTVGRSTDPPDPGEYMVPCGIYVAETRGQAKLMLLSEHWRTTEREEFVDVRTNCLEQGTTDAPAGPLAEPTAWTDEGDPPDGPYARLWGLVVLRGL